MSEILSGCSNCIISQSMAARESITEVNADGCGLGWYNERKIPGSYRSVMPAWSDPNFSSLTNQIKAPVFMAHVRAATTGEVSYANCHPFIWQKYSFMHNGMISDYRKIRPRIEEMVEDDLYENVKGSTDSEAIFHAALSRGLTENPNSAMSEVLQEVSELQQEKLGEGRVRFSAVMSDGEKIWAYRWASDDNPPTLYYREYLHGWIIASEPIDDATWVSVPNRSLLEIDLAGNASVSALTH